ncbi:MAG: hypothetical protein KTR26_16060 [Flammeovirgaceae bacterium]|nr:hypothetical protein [Flammeovirgaceae bacterium]
MNLDELKTTWTDYTSELVHENEVAEAQVHIMLSQQPESIISKINKSLLFEFSLLFLCSVIFLFVINQYPENHFLFDFSLMMLGVCVVFSGFFIYQYKAINSLDYGAENLSESLKKSISSLNSFIKIYFYSNAILAPIGFFVGMLFSYNIFQVESEGENESSTPTIMQVDEYLIFFILAAVLVFVFFFFFTKIYIHKLYGVHLKSLKECLAELESA